jgi:predicted NBD/HSP70 family sugar kinase
VDADGEIAQVPASGPAGYVLRHQVWRGDSNMAGELGHLPLEPDGRPCVCGNSGCLETVAGGDGVLASINAVRSPAAASIEAAAELARRGDESAQRAFRRAGVALGWGLSWLVNLGDPGLVLVWVNTAMRAMDGYERAARDAFEEHRFHGSALRCELDFRDHDHRLGARSAGAMALRR